MFLMEICGNLLLGGNLMLLTKFSCELQKKIKKSYIYSIAYHLVNSFGNDVISKPKKKDLHPSLSKRLKEMRYCDHPIRRSSALFHVYSWIQTRRQSSALRRRGALKIFVGQNIYIWE